MLKNKQKEQLELLLKEINKISEYWITELGGKFWRITEMTEEKEMVNFLNEWKRKSKEMIIDFGIAVRPVIINELSAEKLLAGAFRNIEEGIGDLCSSYIDKQQALAHSQKIQAEVNQEIAEL